MADACRHTHGMVLESPPNHRYHPTKTSEKRESIVLCFYRTVAKLLLQANDTRRKEKPLQQTTTHNHNRLNPNLRSSAWTN
jgi:hypothetical protein